MMMRVMMIMIRTRSTAWGRVDMANLRGYCYGCGEWAAALFVCSVCLGRFCYVRCKWPDDFICQGCSSWKASSQVLRILMMRSDDDDDVRAGL